MLVFHEIFMMKYYLSPLFIAGFIFLITGLVIFIWMPLVGMGAVAMLLDWIVRGSDLSRNKKWTLLTIVAVIFLLVFYSLLGTRSSLIAQEANY
jgi:hypothetical protein